MEWEDGQCYEDRSKRDCNELLVLRQKNFSRDLEPIILDAGQDLSNVNLTEVFVIGCDDNEIR